MNICRCLSCELPISSAKSVARGRGPTCHKKFKQQAATPSAHVAGTTAIVNGGHAKL